MLPTSSVVSVLQNGGDNGRYFIKMAKEKIRCRKTEMLRAARSQLNKSTGFKETKKLDRSELRCAFHFESPLAEE
jgi:hypothetical protein